MPKRCWWLTVTILALTAGCGGRHLHTHEPMPGADGAAPDGGPVEAATSTDGAMSADAWAPAADASPDIVPSVDPAVSRRWTWHACGRLSPAGQDIAAAFAADGTMVVQGEEGTVRGYNADGSRRPGSDGRAASLVIAPDGATLFGDLTGRTILFKPAGVTTARFQFDIPTGISCGYSYAFSVAGDYFLASGGGGSCIWRAVDGGFVASVPGTVIQAAIRGETLVTLEKRSDGQVDVVTRDFGGNEASRVKLETPASASALERAQLSPAGDRVAYAYPSPTLWDTDGRKLFTVDPGERSVARPVFSATGDRVLLGDGVFLTSDGTRTAKLPALSRLGDSWPFALSADGRRVIASISGRAALFDLAAPGMTAVLGPPVYWRDRRDPIWTLAISRDSTLAVATAGVVFGVRVAPQFEESPTLWSIFSGDSSLVGDISEDGRWASAAGDNRALYSAVDGRVAWPQPPPAGINCPGTQLRMSPKGNWAAGASYEGTMDVFALGDATRMPWLPVSVLPVGCHEAAAFSRDEQMLATSKPSLYRFDATSADKWQPVWSGSSSSPPGSPWSQNWLADVRFSPDESVLIVSHCDTVLPASCTATLYRAATGEMVQTLADLTAPRPSFSPDGSWIVAGSKLLHLPSGDTRSLDPSLSLTTAVFTPEGDIVAGTEDATLARYCRDR